MMGRGRTKKTWFTDMTGVRVGRLVVIGFDRRDGDRVDTKRSTVHYFWRCKCDCGNEVVVNGAKLRDKHRPTRSCGCLKVEAVKARSTTHGHTTGRRPTAEYRAWRNMLARCTAPENTHYAYYGGRGVTVCLEWQRSFDRFLADMGPKPSRLHSIERIDVNGPYDRSNCKWAVDAEQRSNRRDNVFVTLNGERLTVAEAARRTGMLASTIQRRLRNGWPESELFERRRLYHRKGK